MPSRRSAFRLFLFSLLLVTLGVQAAIPTSGLVGSLKGEFSVDPSGAATYDIPIQLPPNVGGVQPKLSFHYNSNSGNGLMGMGWQLAGLSEITRCPTTLERDGYIDGVDFDSNDQFCLDGQRLVSIGSGLYRTEIDNFSHITGTASAGFTVYAPDGTTLYYGTSSSSQVLAQGKSHVMVWALERVEDMAGNHYRVEYQNDGYSLGEYYPTAIYMGNGSLDLSSVEFEYEDRLDVISGYVAGSRYQTSQRLVGVETLSNKYLPDYGINLDSEGRNISVINRFNMCNPSGSCLSALGVSAAGSESKLSDSGSWFDESTYKVWGEDDKPNRVRNVDINGDGLDDVLIGPKMDSGEWMWLQNDGTEFVDRGYAYDENNKYAEYYDDTQRIRNIDVTGDGLSDILIGPNINTGEWFLLENVNGKFRDKGAIYQSNNYKDWGKWPNRIRDVDMNGDGLVDVLIGPTQSTGKWYWLQNDGVKLIDRGFAFDENNRYAEYYDDTQRIRNVDVTGDGLSDILIGPNINTGEWFLLENVNGKFRDKGAIYQSNNYKDWGKWPNRIRDVDMDGDGLVDVLIGPSTNTGDWYVLLNDSDASHKTTVFSSQDTNVSISRVFKTLCHAPQPHRLI